METLNINGNKIKVRKVENLEGFYISNLSDWNKEVGNILASQDNLKLNENHWRILNEFRNYYNEFQCYPSDKALKDNILYNCKISYEDFLKLFPKAEHQAARISGICLPTGYGYTLS